MLYILLSFSFLSYSEPPVYSWQTCVDMAVQNNADILAGAENLKATKYQEGARRANFFPEVTLDMGGSRFDQSIDGTTPTAPLESYSVGATATQNLFAGFRDYANVKQAKANTAAVNANLRIIKARISFELKSSYQGLLYAKEFSKLTQDIIRRRSDNLRLVELRYENGRENKGSLLLSRANFSQSQLDDLQARNAQLSSRANLARAIGIDETDNFDIQDEIPSRLPPDRGNMHDLAMQTPEHVQAVAQYEAADYGLMSTRSTFFPTFDIRANVSRFDTHIYPDRQDNWSLGFTVSYPLFRGFRDISNIRTASHNASQAFVNRVSVDRSLLSRVTTVYNQFVEANARFEVNKSFREATQVRAEIARNKYNNGLLTFEDWDIIEADLINRQINYLVSLRDKAIAEAAWEQALGQGVIP